uniref:Uncharacterized protein n=1 Tax=Gorilla gorilla gorilla TaxID=9595 RepID=G3RY43_GORGO
MAHVDFRPPACSPAQPSHTYTHGLGLHRRPGAGHCSASPGPAAPTARMPGRLRG